MQRFISGLGLIAALCAGYVTLEACGGGGKNPCESLSKTDCKTGATDFCKLDNDKCVVDETKSPAFKSTTCAAITTPADCKGYNKGTFLECAPTAADANKCGVKTAGTPGKDKATCAEYTDLKVCQGAKTTATPAKTCQVSADETKCEDGPAVTTPPAATCKPADTAANLCKKFAKGNVQGLTTVADCGKLKVGSAVICKDPTANDGACEAAAANTTVTCAGDKDACPKVTVFNDSTDTTTVACKFE